MVIAEERLFEKRQHAQKWLRLSELPSERFAEGLRAALGGVVLELVAENRLFVAEPEGDLIEPEDDFVLGHGECNAFAF